MKPLASEGCSIPLRRRRQFVVGVVLLGRNGSGQRPGVRASPDATRPRVNDFTVLVPLIDAITPDDARAETGDITHILTIPWMFYSGRDARTAERSVASSGLASTWVWISPESGG